MSGENYSNYLNFLPQPMQNSIFFCLTYFALYKCIIREQLIAWQFLYSHRLKPWPARQNKMYHPDPPESHGMKNKINKPHISLYLISEKNTRQSKIYCSLSVQKKSAYLSISYTRDFSIWKDRRVSYDDRISSVKQREGQACQDLWYGSGEKQLNSS